MLACVLLNECLNACMLLSQWMLKCLYVSFSMNAWMLACFFFWINFCLFFFPQWMLACSFFSVDACLLFCSMNARLAFSQCICINKRKQWRRRRRRSCCTWKIDYSKRHPAPKLKTLIERKKEEILDFSRKTIILTNKLVCRLFALVGFTLSGVQLRFWLL